MRQLLMLLMCVLPFAASAQWAGEAGAGYLSTSGNSRTSSASARFNLDYTAGVWKNSFSATAINTADRGTTSAERYTVADKVDWNFSERHYAFAALDFDKDLFGGVRQRTSETLGYGYRFLLGPVHRLETEIGAGARQTEAQRVADVRGERESEFIGRGFGKYQWQISETSAFAQSLKVEAGDSNTFSESVTELKLSILGNLFASLSYTLKNNSDVPEGTDKTDSFSAVSLSYKFGDGT
jgi:putative salt-induced outer membrane protein